jgi:hypothetical protein
MRALEEAIRCVKVGGDIKIMIYNRHSLVTFYHYLKSGLLKGKPFMSFADVLFNHVESAGTKAYTLAEMKGILDRYPVEVKSLTATVSNYDLLWKSGKLQRTLAYILACVLGRDRCGWFLTFELRKTGSPVQR